MESRRLKNSSSKTHGLDKPMTYCVKSDKGQRENVKKGEKKKADVNSERNAHITY